MDALQQRKVLKARKPHFMRQDAHKKGKLKNNWRRPKGSDSKMRVSRRGYRRCIGIGWGSPQVVKGVSRQGLKLVCVHNVAGMDALDPKKDCAVLSSSVGLKTKLEMLALAIKKNVAVHNVKDPAKYVEDGKKSLQDRKALSDRKRQARSEKKEKAQKEAEKKKKEEKAKEAEASEEAKAEEKKAEEKKEKDKILTKKQ